VTVQAEGKEKFTVRFVPPTKPSHELPKADGADPTRTANKDALPDAVPAVKTPSSQESIKNSIGMTFELIPAGEFLMGSPDNDKGAEKHEKPQHRVRITRPFYLGAYEVTQAQYEAVMGNNPSYFSASGNGSDRVVAGQSTDRHPVENVSWLDAVKFCNKLGEMEGRPPFFEIDGENVRVPDWSRPGYRLPTEAEWEYACRANAPTVTRYSFGNDAASLGEFAWYKGNSGRKTHPVGETRPNGFGLFDMHGNVWEWCWDGYGEGYYKESREDDPRGSDGAANRVLRGGAWDFGPQGERSAFRLQRAGGYLTRGFRVARGQSGR
jgi:formylglycine-generating enzyme required for sulfatase activity